MKRFFLIVALVVGTFMVSQEAFAVLPATGVIEMRSTATANNVNGGGFNSARGGTDYTLQDAAQTTNTNGSAAGGTTFTSVNGAFTDAMKGNYIRLTASTGLTLGWYEIVSVTDSDNVELDRTPGTGTLTTYNVGGALSFVSSVAGRNEDAVFEMGVPGNIFWLKGNGASYTIGDAISTSAAGTTSSIIQFNGYSATRGDNPTGTGRPTIVAAASVVRPGSYWRYANLIITITTAGGLDGGTFDNNTIANCKVTNTSTTAGRVAIYAGRDVINCEAISYRGVGVWSQFIPTNIVNCYIHDCNIGISMDTSGTARATIVGNIIASCVTSAISVNGANAGGLIMSNTLYGSQNTTGTGVLFAAATSSVNIINNIIYGFTTGVNAFAQTVQNSGYDNYNSYNNNDTNATNWTLGPSSITTAPGFTSVAQVTGATATTSGSVLTQSGADFTASGVVAGQDFLYLVSGTGITAGVYGITAVGTTTVTLDIAPGTSATADKVFQITTGRNFAIGTALKALGYPGVFPGALTTGYMDIGAAQRQEAGGGGQKSYSF